MERLLRVTKLEIPGAEWLQPVNRSIKEKRNWGRDRGRTATFVHRRPPAALISLPPFLLPGVRLRSGAHSAFLQSDIPRPRHVCDLVQSRPWRAGTRTFSTCTCGCSGRLLGSFFFFPPFFPLPRSSGFQNHLANNQQVGQTSSPRWTDAVGRFNAS